jgi:hypothetical protein
MKNEHWVTVAVDVFVSGSKHCSNSCPFLDTKPDTRPKQVTFCTLFAETELVWDKRRKLNGYKRCAQCKTYERGWS